jgi:excinuclease ABC subunit A
MTDYIKVRGARVHNLRNIDLDIPRDCFVVVTGVSGSGKSSLAFDTLFAEGQRRYVESLSTYARQFLGQLDKPEADLIAGLSPAICINQRGVSQNPRSTVGTVTEIYDYLRLLFSRVGEPHCIHCNRLVSRHTIQEMVDRILQEPQGSKLLILAPIPDLLASDDGVFSDALHAGFVRARINGEVIALDPLPVIDGNSETQIEIVVDRIVIGPDQTTRIADSLETALRIGAGAVLIQNLAGPEFFLSEHFYCGHCKARLPDLEPRAFSFNSPHGACGTCDGLGVTLDFDPALVVPDLGISITEGALAPIDALSSNGGTLSRLMHALSEKFDFSLSCPFRDIPKIHRDMLLYGNDGNPVTVQLKKQSSERQVLEFEYEGLIPYLRRQLQDSNSMYVRHELERFMTSLPCANCNGSGLRVESLAVQFAGRSIADYTEMNIAQASMVLSQVKMVGTGECIARPILAELNARLSFMVNVGLDYLTLDRRAGTLSGGEAQRIRLATQIGSALVGVMYILDEPSIGLHQRDNARLLETLKGLRDAGNSVIVVEHDEEIIRSADWLVDMGPGAGRHGGRIVFEGTITALEAADSLTAKYINREYTVPYPQDWRSGNGDRIVVEGARENNLKSVDVEFPLGMLIGVTGVSGSGKSTLVSSVLQRSAARQLHGGRDHPGECDRVIGLENIDKVVAIDQSPIGRTPRSNPATYTGIFTAMRELFSAVPEARARGYKPGRFSFNVKGGRCEACQGAGVIQIEMQFLPDVYVACEVCDGRRYNREVIEIFYRGHNIADVLDMSVETALESFGSIPRIMRPLQALKDVGLGYLTLGQRANTLSGGEAQRVKIASELAKRSSGKTLYILDEPTTGMHFADVAQLISVLQRLVDQGNTVVVVEHNLDVIKNADYVIDLGPEGGAAGGEIVACGTPIDVAASGSHTGEYLKQVLPVQDRPLVGGTNQL